MDTNGTGVAAIVGLIVLTVFGVLAVLLIAPILGALFGALTGWVVGLFFPVTFNTFFSALGLGMLAPWQIGMMLGFTGGFFKGIIRLKKDS